MCQAVMPSMRGGRNSSWLVVWPSFLFAERWTVSFFSREQDFFIILITMSGIPTDESLPLEHMFVSTV